MDTESIVADYAKQDELEVKGTLKDGGEIVGQEVDDDNHLYYVVRRDEEITIEKANKVEIQDFELNLSVGIETNHG